MAYVDCFLASVRADVTKEDYRAFCEAMDGMFKEFGATRVVDSWADDVPRGQVTDLYRAVAAEEGETPVFGWIEWPDKAARTAGWEKAMADPRMQPGQRQSPFDGKRMIFGGFETILDI
jgi:uncharacterized protein YbaA (DUF1428 family)